MNARTYSIHGDGRRLLLTIIAIVLAACQMAAGQDDPSSDIHPASEQGRRAIIVGFRPPSLPAERTAQDDGIPTSRLTPIEDITREQALAQSSEEIRQRYPDGKTQILKYVQQDADGNFFNHGPWTLYNPDGQVIAEGQFENGLMQGTWRRWHDANDAAIREIVLSAHGTGALQSIADFANGKLHGSWIIQDSLERKLFEMPYVAGVRHGKASWWRTDGSVLRELTFEQGLLHGMLVEYAENQLPSRQTQFMQGRRVYSHTTWFGENRKQTEDYFLDAVLRLEGDDDWWEARPAQYYSEGEAFREGPTRAWYENGQQRMSGQFQNNRREGQFTWWHSNGQRQLVGQYSEDIKTGQWTWWHANGMKSVQGSYENGAPVGVWNFWDENGKVIRSSDLTGAALEEIPANDLESLILPLDQFPVEEELPQTDVLPDAPPQTEAEIPLMTPNDATESFEDITLNDG